MKGILPRSNGKGVFQTRKAIISSFLIILSIGVYGQPELLKDINTTLAVRAVPYSSLRSTPTHVFYLDGSSLWVTKGSAANTVELKRFIRIDPLTVVGSSVYFAADDGSGAGTELWKSNGSSVGTVRIKDILPGRGSSEPAFITMANSTTIYFTARNGMNGRELWKTNGMAGGTVMVKDIFNGKGSSNPSFITKVDDLVFFAANDGQNGTELWKSNGTTSGTAMVKNIHPGYKIGGRPQLLTEVGGKLFFRANNSISNVELYSSDGSATGTLMVKDIRRGETGGDVENLVNVNGVLFFTANDGIHGDELWKTNGFSEGTRLVKDLNPGPGGSNNTSSREFHMGDFLSADGILFFTAGKGTDEQFVVRSDGTATGTYRVSDLQAVAFNDLQPRFTYLNGFVYYFAQMLNVNGYAEYHLLQMNLNGEIVAWIHQYPTPEDFSEPFVQEMVAFGNALYVSALSSDGWQLVKHNATGESVILNSGLWPTESGAPEPMVKVGNQVYFRVRMGAWDSWLELWRTDGTTEGTIPISPLGLYDDSYELLPVNNKLFFTTGAELFVTEPSVETTASLIWSDNPDLTCRKLTNVHGVVHFEYGSGELWKTDGTKAGTIKIQTLHNIISITDVGGQAFVLNQTYSGGLELWRTNGPDMLRVKVLREGHAVRSENSPTAAINNILYFVSNDGVHGNEVWRSDGTGSGTVMITDLNKIDSLNSNGNEGDIQSLSVYDNKLFVSATDASNKWQLFMVTGKNSVVRISTLNPVTRSITHQGRFYLFTTGFQADGYRNALYVTDGTTTGATTFLTSALYGSVDEAIVGDRLYFSSSDARRLMEVTDCGVFPVDVGNSAVFPIEVLKDDLIFNGYRNDVGFEPFVYRNISEISNQCPSTVAFDATRSDNSIASWPNPYTSAFTLRIPGTEGQKADLVVFNAGGFPVESFTGLSMNTDYENLGATWPKGIYTMKIRHGGKVTTKRLVRK